MTGDTSPADAVPPGAQVLPITLTARGEVQVNDRTVAVTHDDPRLDVVSAAIDYARRMGHPVPVLLRLPDGTTRSLIAAPEMSVHLDALILAAHPSESPPEQAGPATATLTHETVAMLAARPQPPEGFAPDAVQAWPTLRITLHADGTADVDHQPVPRLRGVDVHTVAVAVAAILAQQRGLNRPVRAVALDPDGTTWPLIIHPNGTATNAGPPTRPPKRKRRLGGLGRSG